MFKIEVTKSSISATETEELASGAQKAYLINFTFSEEWSGLAKTAVFKAGSSAGASPFNARTVVHPVEVTLIGTDTIFIPHEVLKIPHLWLQVGVRGTTTDGETIIPTVYCDLGKIGNGAERGENTTPPTPELIDQITALTNTAVNEATTAKELAEALAVVTELKNAQFNINTDGHLVLDLEAENGNS